MVIVIVVIAGVDGYFVVKKVGINLGYSPSPTVSPTPTDRVCLQVITRAKNNKTGEVRDFPNSCILEGWVQIKPSEGIEATINWKTYTSSNNYFTFNYPANWYLGSDPSYSAVLRSSASSAGFSLGLLGSNELGVEISLAASNNTQEIRAWCENDIANFQFSHLTAQFSNGQYITVGESRVYSVEYRIKEDSRLNGRQICVTKNNDKFRLVAGPLNSSLFSEFNKIVASFKFTK